MSILISFLAFIIVLTVCVSIHELGHLVTAKIFGVYCYEYSIGMGPKIYSRKGKETTFSIRAFPVGGYVSMAGESDQKAELAPEVVVPAERTIQGVNRGKQVIIMLAGVFMNFVLAFLLLSALAFSQGVYRSPAPIINEVLENSAAQQAGLQSGDEIVSLSFNDGTITYPKTFNAFSVAVQLHSGEPVTIVINRQGTSLTVLLTPTYYEADKTYKVGVSSLSPTHESLSLGQSMSYALSTMVEMISTMVFSIGQILRGQGMQNLSGPIGILQASGQAAQSGLVTFLSFIAIISLSLGFMNLLPIPVMDGGRVLITAIEAIFRKPLNQRIQSALMMGSFALLLLLLVVVSYHDVLRLF